MAACAQHISRMSSYRTRPAGRTGSMRTRRTSLRAACTCSSSGWPQSLSCGCISCCYWAGCLGMGGCAPWQGQQPLARLPGCTPPQEPVGGAHGLCLLPPLLCAAFVCKERPLCECTGLGSGLGTIQAGGAAKSGVGMQGSVPKLSGSERHLGSHARCSVCSCWLPRRSSWPPKPWMARAQ